jgi:hypothetical protein
MAERRIVKAKQPPAVKPRAKAAEGAAVNAENARLKEQLAEALERIADLELKQTEIINRIDWVIDSLHNLPD